MNLDDFEKEAVKKMILPPELADIIKNGKAEMIIPQTREELMELALGGVGNMEFDVKYDVPGKGEVLEAHITKCKNGIVANYPEPYMRRRDPDSMVIADSLPTDKARHEALFGERFDHIRQETFQWFKEQKELILMPFMSGSEATGICYPSLLLAPANAAFFAAALADLQGFVPCDKIPNMFKPKAVLYVAPPFRHLYYGGKQYVVHNRAFDLHEVFSYNLYPGPSAKKGVYSVLLNAGEQERWLTCHAATARLLTPYEMQFVVMHEGASGGGKSEMLEQFHRERDGRMKLGVNTVTGEEVFLTIADSCEIEPVTDDMAICHPSLRTNSNKLVVADAENGWFLRVNHIDRYGTDYNTEYNTIHPAHPLVFLNMEATPGATCLIWEPVMDAPGKPCPNPRVIMPREHVKNHVDGAVEVDVRSFGLRQPPSTHKNPDYGIAGIFHVLPPALAWLWRLTAPRGYSNPSIIDTEAKKGKMTSEGVGSYWPFATGKMVDHANLLLTQILRTPSTRYILAPNQHIGAYKVGFAGQWVAREFLARRGGAKFRPEQLEASRCPLLGYSPQTVRIGGSYISRQFLRTHLQPELGEEGYDKGAGILNEFFKEEVKRYLTPELDALGRQIIEVCLSDGGVEDYYDLIPKL